MTYYIKGGSKFNEANPKVWVGLFLGGFPDADYLLTDWKNLDDKGHETAQDPFWRLGGSAGGAKEFELGLWNDYRIKFETTGITYWDGDSWEDLLALGGATNLVDLGDVVISTPADNEVLAYNNATSKWINQTAAEAGLATAGHGHAQLHDESHNLASHSTKAHSELTDYNAEANVKHLTDAQVTALHAIYSLESHNNTYHSTNYHTEADGTGVATVHSDLVTIGSGNIITTGERNALHTIYQDSAAVSAVNAAGLSLASGQVIISADEDLTFTFGRVMLRGVSDIAYWNHRDAVYALAQTALGRTTLNTKSNVMDFNYDNVLKMRMSDTVFTMSIPIAMGANVITSDDADLTFTFGRASLGSPDADVMFLGHRDNLTNVAYALKQLADGNTAVNAKTGKILYFNIAGIPKAWIGASALTIASGQKLIFEGLTPAEALEIYDDNATTGSKYITQLVDGWIYFTGYHGIYFGTNEGGLFYGMNLTPSALTIGVDTNLTGVLDVRGTSSVIWLTDTNTTDATLKIEAVNGTYNFTTANSSHAENVTPISFNYAGAITIGGSVAMSNNKITGLTAGSASGEAVEFDQLHSQSHDNTDHSTNYLANLSEDASPQLGASLDLNDKQITHELVAAVSLVAGDLCYMNGSGKMAKADASAEATCDTLLAMCLDTISADATGTFLIFGKWTTSGLTAGAEYFVSLVAGGIIITRPSNTGEIIRHVGTAVSTTVLFFNPSHTYVEYVV